MPITTNLHVIVDASPNEIEAITQSVPAPGEACAHHDPGLILDITIDL